MLRQPDSILPVAANMPAAWSVNGVAYGERKETFTKERRAHRCQQRRTPKLPRHCQVAKHAVAG